MRHARSVEDVGPVGVGHAVPHTGLDDRLGVGKLAGLLLPVDILGSVHDLGVVAEAAEGKLVVVEDVAVLVLVLGAVLRCDENDTVTGLRTVDSGGGGILQNFHGFDHGRIEVVDLVDLQTVHDEERAEAGTAVGGDTADADGSSFTRGTGIVEDLHAGGLALEGGGCIGRGTVLEFGLADRGHGSGEVALALHTVTDHDGLFEHLVILFEDDVEDALVADGDGLSLVADALDGDACSGGNAQRESAIQICGCANARIADHGDGSADDGFSAGVDDSATDGTVLGGGLKTPP